MVRLKACSVFDEEHVTVKFQFLSGAIKSTNDANGNPRLVEFQFLSGAIKSKLSVSDRAAAYDFNS